MIVQTVARFCSVLTCAKYFLQRLIIYVIRKVFHVKVSCLLWSIFLVLCFIWTFGCRTKIVNNSANVSLVQNTEFPVLVWWSNEFTTLPGYIHCPKKCEIVRRNVSDHNLVQAYLFYGTHFDLDDLPLPRKWETVLWGLFHEESPRNTIMLMHERALRLFNYSSTFSRYSDYPFPLQYLHDIEEITNIEYFVKSAKKNAFLEELAPIVFVQSDCGTATERDEYVEKLMEIMKVDSYGECLNNKELPAKFKEDYLNNMYEEDFLRFVARYKFMITIENGVCEDYITEKLWRALIAGTVPIYFGSPSVRDWLPNNNSAILLQEYPTPEILKGHLEKLMKDDELYESHLDHKMKQLIANQRLFNELKARPGQSQVDDSAEKFQCLMCEKLHQRLDGVKENRVLNRSHYDCPKPISALTLDVNPSNFWVVLWEETRYQLDVMYKKWEIES